MTSFILSMIYNVAKKSNNYDIIHEHLGPYGTILSKLCNTPVLSTMHYLVTIPRLNLYQKVKENYHIVSISNYQRKNYRKLNFIKTIYNGIPIDDYQYSNIPGKYLCFLGRLDKLKGVKEGIKAAKLTGNKLILAGQVSDHKFFDQSIKSEIDNNQITFIGEVNFIQKINLLKNAKALLCLVNWDEPFGLVAPEANACGTPVIAVPKGAFAEIIYHGINGYLTDGSIESAVDLINKIENIKREDCRKYAENNFSVNQMVSKYEEVYQKLATMKNIRK